MRMNSMMVARANQSLAMRIAKEVIKRNNNQLDCDCCHDFSPVVQCIDTCTHNRCKRDHRV
jgi:hypothetical protein